MNILAFGEVMLRYTVNDHKMLEQTDDMTVTTVGTGVNLLSSLAHFGYDTSILTVLPDNPIGKKLLQTYENSVFPIERLFIKVTISVVSS